MMISGRTMVFGIFGYPVEHTFSPGMHNAAFAKLGMDACYVPYAVAPTRLKDAVRSIIPLGLRGLNITVPHKEKVIPFLDDVTEDARLIGAVNTIEVRGGRLIGHNTDGRGFLRSLREGTAFRPKGKRVLIVGAGGAARAIAFNLALNGAAEIVLSDTDVKKAGRLAGDVQRTTKVRAGAVPPAGLRVHARDSHCIINATPLGLHRGDPMPVSRDLVREGHLVCDLVYNPPITPLLKAAASRGALTLSGIGMLLYQGVIAFEVWTGKKAPIEIMRRALVRQMGVRRK
jgi:shikimate dehydrogenase